MTSEPLYEIKFLNLWKYLWLHHLSGKMSLVSAHLVILPLDMGPKFFHLVLYEYLRVFLNTPYVNSTLLRNEKIFMVLKLSSQENPQRAEKSSKI